MFFDARSVPDYGAMSGNRLDELRPGHRSEGEVDEAQALPRRLGAVEARRPSARADLGRALGSGLPRLAHRVLGDVAATSSASTIDVHTGGIDLRFPHHEDERAQSNAAVGHEVVRHWVHGEHLLFDGRKMAKSTGNVVLLSDVVGRGLDPLAVRLAFLEHRYRQQMNLTWDDAEAADSTAAPVARAGGRVGRVAVRPMHAPTARGRGRAFDDDLDTPRALQALRELETRRACRPARASRRSRTSTDCSGLDLARRRRQSPPRWRSCLRAARRAAGGAGPRPGTAKDWAASDRLRDELAALGVRVTDTPQGQTWV